MILKMSVSASFFTFFPHLAHFGKHLFDCLLTSSSDCAHRIISPFNIVPDVFLGQIAGPCCYQEGIGLSVQSG